MRGVVGDDREILGAGADCSAAPLELFKVAVLTGVLVTGTNTLPVGVLSMMYRGCPGTGDAGTTGVMARGTFWFGSRGDIVCTTGCAKDGVDFAAPTPEGTGLFGALPIHITLLVFVLKGNGMGLGTGPRRRL